MKDRTNLIIDRSFENVEKFKYVLMAIYWHIIYSQLGTTGNTVLSLIYTLYSSPLHTH
jgi:hypothetical protein